MTDTATERAKEGIWVGLRRRKVVQWGLAYAAGAWVLLQVLGFAADAFAWPLIIKQLSMLGLVAGFPTIVALAWYHGDRGQQRVTGSELAVLTLLLLGGGGLLWLYAQRSGPAATATVAAKPMSTSAATDTRPSIAVLPFENRSREADDAFFVDGIHDDILTHLTKVGALKVIARTSVEKFRDSKLTTKEIGEKLGVTKVLEGGVQRAGDRVRVTVQLIDAATDAHVWAESYDRELSAANIFAIQSEVATAIAGALKASLTVGEQARLHAVPTESLEAWKAYQLGKQRTAKRTSAALTEAEGYFRDALALDPGFALAWAGLADVIRLQTSYTGRAQGVGLAEAEQAVARALELDPSLAEAWAASGGIAYVRVQYERAEQMLRRAIALNSNYAPAHHWLFMTLSELGRRDEALALMERATLLDPFSVIICTNLGLARADVGRFDDALVAFQQAIEIDSAIPSPYASIGDLHASGFGRFDTAVTWYKKAAALDPGNPELAANVAYAHWHLGDDVEARQWLDRMQANRGETAFTNAVAVHLYLARGDLASARTHAQRAAELDRWNMDYIRNDDLRKGDYATARARYAEAFPELFTKELPKLTHTAALAAVELALVLQHTGEGERALVLLKHSEDYIRAIPRMGFGGYRIADVAIHALRGETAKALTSLREAERAGWRLDWRYHRDFDPKLASIRNEPEFKAVFADIERDMTAQRAQLASLSKDAPLELSSTSR